MAYVALNYYETSTYPLIVWDVTADSVALDLTGATATVIVTNEAGTTVETDSGGVEATPAAGEIAITSAAAGEVSYHPSATVTATAGNFQVWLKVVTADGNVMVFAPTPLTIHDSPWGA